MRERRAALVVGLAVAALALAGCGDSNKESSSAATGTPKATLKGRVGPGPTISLKTESGKPVKTLVAGTYVFEVDDLSESHNFHLTGPGIDEKTLIEATATDRFTRTLKPGTYTFVCDAHKDSMHGSFTVSGGK
jgi:plastocyanin